MTRKELGASLKLSRKKKQMNKQSEMAYISYSQAWEKECYNIVSKRDKWKDLIINQLKLEIHDTYKKFEKNNSQF